MKASTARCLCAVLAVFVLAGCEVTPEKIELWKGTKNGPKKLASALIDPKVDMELRAKAAVALVEISSRGWNYFREAFSKMEKTDAQKVVAAVVPMMAAMIEKEGSPITKSQVDAKDALFVMLDYAAGEGKAQAEAALISWSVKDFNTRALAGQYNITTIVKKIGPAAAEALVPMLVVQERTIEHIAKLIRDAGDDKAVAKASASFAKNLRENLDKVQEVHLVSAAIVGGDPIADALLDMATNKEVEAKLQRFALRAFSEGLATKSIHLSEAHAKRLFSMAKSSEYDKYQREETYYVIAQARRNEDIPVFYELLASDDSFWRAVAFRCILRVDGQSQLPKALRQIARSGLSENKDDVEEIVDRTASFPQLLPKVRELLDDSDVFVQAVAVQVLARIGTSEDTGAVGKLVDVKKRLPKGFGYKTLGEAAKASVAAIKKKG